MTLLPHKIPNFLSDLLSSKLEKNAQSWSALTKELMYFGMDVQLEIQILKVIKARG